MWANKRSACWATWPLTSCQLAEHPSKRRATFSQENSHHSPLLERSVIIILFSSRCTTHPAVSDPTVYMEKHHWPFPQKGRISLKGLNFLLQRKHPSKKNKLSPQPHHTVTWLLVSWQNACFSYLYLESEISHIWLPSTFPHRDNQGVCSCCLDGDRHGRVGIRASRPAFCSTLDIDLASHISPLSPFHLFPIPTNCTYPGLGKMRLCCWFT